MSRTAIAVVGVTWVALSGAALAQQVFVYPQKGQSQQQQDVDTAECARWAKAQSGVDPTAAPQQQAQLGTHSRGTLGGAAKGAALGAAIGAIAGDAGKGAAIGAVGGGAMGRRGSKQQQQGQQAEAQDAYNRAFAACMEARGYTVK
jgi:hypothetical protein